VEKFWPVKGWTEENLKKLKENKFEFKGTKSKQEEIELPKTQPNSQELDTPGKLPKKGIIYSA
jgi:hypothetical protein